MVQSCGVPPRCVILAPVPVPYREPLFAQLAQGGRIDPKVIYLAGAQPGWDQRPDWFAARGGYDSEVLRSWQRQRPGRTPLMLARGLGRALARADPQVVVSSEYGPATWRALSWCRRHDRRLVIMSELTPGATPRCRGCSDGSTGSSRRGWTASSCSARRVWSASGGWGSRAVGSR